MCRSKCCWSKPYLAAFSFAQIDLSCNQLCGLDRYGDGTYADEGIKAIANGISVSASLTAADLQCNFFDADVEQRLRNAVKDRDSFELNL